MTGFTFEAHQEHLHDFGPGWTGGTLDGVVFVTLKEYAIGLSGKLVSWRCGILGFCFNREG